MDINTVFGGRSSQTALVGLLCRPRPGFLNLPGNRLKAQAGPRGQVEGHNGEGKTNLERRIDKRKDEGSRSDCYLCLHPANKTRPVWLESSPLAGYLVSGEGGRKGRTQKDHRQGQLGMGRIKSPQ